MAILVFSMVFAAYFGLALRTADAESNMERKDKAYVEVMVKKGDTIWHLAHKYHRGNNDIRKVIHIIKKVNNIADVNIVPGEILKIPQF